METLTQTADLERHLGPLAHLIGAWEGEKGHDLNASAGASTDIPYRETIAFEPVGPIANGSGELYGLRYSTYAWAYEGSEKKPIHEELGYWFWSEAEQQVIRCFTNHSGVAINAGGRCDKRAHSFEVAADAGAETFGITSTPFLNNACRTVSYKLKLDIQDEDHFSYQEEMHLRGDGQEFVHRDGNALTKVY